MVALCDFEKSRLFVLASMAMNVASLRFGVHGDERCVPTFTQGSAAREPVTNKLKTARELIICKDTYETIN